MTFSTESCASLSQTAAAFPPRTDVSIYGNRVLIFFNVTSVRLFKEKISPGQGSETDSQRPLEFSPLRTPHAFLFTLCSFKEHFFPRARATFLGLLWGGGRSVSLCQG